MTHDPRNNRSQMAPFPDYTSTEPGIFDIEDTAQLCSDCGDEMPSTHASCRCPVCREEYEQELAQASALLELRVEKPMRGHDEPRPTMIVNDSDWSEKK